MSCDIFNQTLLDTASNTSIDISFLQNLFVDYSDSISGIWLPIVITPSNSDTTHCELLAQPSQENTQIFNPCDCNDNQIFGLEYSAFESPENITTECEYCTTCDDPCERDSGCEVRMQQDDYLPKIPYLHQGYISGFYDFKNLKQFPACSNSPLGKEKFITMDSSLGPNLYIDWKLQETISEIPYDAYSSRHNTEYIHNKSYIKSKIKSKTCGAFIKKNSEEFPNNIIKPYGFTNQTYDNIYIGEKRLGSHWKWNYQSGIMGWYRHFDTQRQDDERPIAGIDIFIPSGDVFYARLQTDDPTSSNCPIGLKLTNGTSFADIIPDDTEFFYISQNIYSNFLICKERISKFTNDAQELLEKSLLLVTHPEYDNIVTDLYDDNINETRNDLFQLSTLNQYMTRGTDFKSAFNLYYCQTTDILIDTLARKYGCYLEIPSNSDEDIIIPGSVGQGSSFYIDIDFDMVIPQNKRRFNSAAGAMLPNNVNYSRNFKYDQTFSVGGTDIVYSVYNNYRGLDESCTVDDNDVANYQQHNYANYSSIYFYNTEVGAVINNSGSYFFENKYNDTTLIRKYPASAFNPHIDLVAVHQQGGVYVNAIPFGLTENSFFTSQASSPGGAISINFETGDCAIKVYDLKVKKLQSSSPSSRSKECERFPYSTGNMCQCFGFGYDGFERTFFRNSSNSSTIGNIEKYTPNLSTNNSPILKKYGGYSQSYLDKLFGRNIATAGGTISQLNSRIDPLNPYNCEKETSIKLYNYINTEWDITLNNMSRNHADIVLTVSEGVQLNASRWKFDLPGIYSEPPSNASSFPWFYPWTLGGALVSTSVANIQDHSSFANENLIPNMNWKRFTTKVTVNNSENLYDEEQAVLNNIPINSSFPIKLSNPFLATLINDHDNVYVPDSNEENNCDVQPHALSRRGDETSIVTLTFKQVPRKNLLNFYIPAPTSYGTLTRGKFDPNKGLEPGSDTKNPIKNNKPYYEHTIDGSDFDTNKGILYGDIVENVHNLSNIIYNMEYDRKIKIYIKIGSIWYTINNPKRESYTVKGKKYIGRPKLFEYVSSESKSRNIAGLKPLIPKKLFPWNFALNHAKFTNASATYLIDDTYPFINGKKVNIGLSDSELILDGSRYYFMVEETSVFADPGVNSFNDVENITNNFGNRGIVDFNGEEYIYLGGGENIKGNYVFAGKSAIEIFRNNKSFKIKYDDFTDGGYVYETARDCNHQIKIFRNNNGVISSTTNIIEQKQIGIKLYDKDYKPTLSNPVYMKIYTKFHLQNRLNVSNGASLYGVDIGNYNNNICLLAYLETNHNDQNKYLHNKNFVTKWADVIDYDDTSAIELINDPNKNIALLYDLPVYENWFFKQIVNNFSANYNFRLSFFDGVGNREDLDIESDNVYYNILQKYNLQNDNEFLDMSRYQDYHNFIPMMDINIMGQSLTNADSILNPTIRGLPSTGLIYSANWVKPVSSYTSPAIDPEGTSNPQFFINIENEDQIQGAFIPAGLYSDTLRLDDPTFWLDRTSVNTSYDSSNMRTIFQPSVNTLSPINKRLSGFSHVVETREHPFSIYPVYGDGDDDSACGAQECFMSTRGYKELIAHLKLAEPNNYSSSIPASCDYFITYDAGSYTPIGQKNLISIFRSELEADNPLYPSLSKCNSDYLRPNYKRTIHDPELQTAISNGLSVAHSDIVNKTDDYANEMLFRIMYGEDDKVNKKIFNSSREPLTADDLANFTDPKITAADIYDEILYNYDKNAVYNNFELNGSFTVIGPAPVGRAFNFSVDNNPITFSITRENGKIYADGSIGNKTFKSIIATEYTTTKSVAVTDANTTLSSTQNTTYALQFTSKPDIGLRYIAWARRIYTGNCISWDRARGADLFRGGMWQHACGATVNDSSSLVYDDVHIQNCAGGNCIGFLNISPRLEFESETTGQDCTNDDCRNIEFGYCRRKNDCIPEGSCKDTETISNFTYNFKQCRTNFNLYGHYYDLSVASPTSSTTTTTFVTPINPNLDDPNFSYALGSSTPVNRGQVFTGYGPAAIRAELHGVNPPGVLNPCVNLGQNNTESFYSQRICDADDPHQPQRDGCRRWPQHLLQPCDGVDSSSNQTESGDPGYDQCGYFTQTNTIPAKNYYLKTTRTDNEDYNPQCPSTICTIRYTNSKIEISVGDETHCITANINDCPQLSATLPAHTYIRESINSKCGGCNDNSGITLNATQQNFQTVRESKSKVIATFSGTDVNPQYIVLTFIGTNGGVGGPPFNNQAYGICGESGMRWYSRYNDAFGNMARGMSLFRQKMTQAFNDLQQEVGASYSAGGSFNTSSVLMWRRICSANTHINEDDMIKGVVPGSCGGIRFETSSSTYKKYRVSQDGTSIEQGTGTYYTVSAVIDYDYIRPVTIQDKLRNILGISCSLPHSEYDNEYPDWYRIPKGGLTPYPSVDNFVKTNPNFKQSASCTTTAQCYYKNTYNNIVYSNFAFGGAPCGRTDYHCWAENSNWLRVWNP